MSDDDRGLLNDLLDIPAYFDPIDRVEGVLCTFYYADWARAARQRGAIGVAFELISAIAGYCAPTITFRRGAGWSGLEIEKLLRRHGVKIWDRGIADSHTLYFCVKRRQVAWAEYLLERAGAPITSQHDVKAIQYGRVARARGMSKEPSGGEKLSTWYAFQELGWTLLVGGMGLVALLVFFGILGK